MVNENDTQLPPVSRWWIGLYCFAAFWLIFVASADASHFGPGFFPLLISMVLVPLLTIIFLLDLCIRIMDAVQGTSASRARRLWPLAVATIGVVVYGGVCIAVMLELS